MTQWHDENVTHGNSVYSNDALENSTRSVGFRTCRARVSSETLFRWTPLTRNIYDPFLFFFSSSCTSLSFIVPISSSLHDTLSVSFSTFSYVFRNHFKKPPRVMFFKKNIDNTETVCCVCVVGSRIAKFLLTLTVIFNVKKFFFSH